MDLTLNDYEIMSDSGLLQTLKALAVACPLSVPRESCPLWDGHQLLKPLFDTLEMLDREHLQALALAHHICWQQLTARHG